MRLRPAAGLLVGGVLGMSSGCGSREPVMNEDAQALQVQEVKAQAAGNDAAAKESKRPRPAAGLMPP